MRRVQGRITTPWIETSTETLTARLASGQPLLDFAQIAFDWNDVRLLIRQVTDVLRRHEVIDAADRRRAAFGRPQPDAARRDARLVRAAAGASRSRCWAKCSAGRRGRTCSAPPKCCSSASASIGWRRRDLPGVRGRAGVLGDHDRAAIASWSAAAATCAGRFNPIACPYCGNDDRTRIKSMATPDGMYRVMICSPCGRYIKALDARKATRPLLPYVDLIATLPLDAAVMKYE